MKKMGRQWLAALLSLAMIFMMLPVTALSAAAQELGTAREEMLEAKIVSGGKAQNPFSSLNSADSLQTVGEGIYGIRGDASANSIDGTIADVQYLNSGGEVQTCTSANSVETDTKTLSEGWYVVENTITVTERIQVQGEVHLILADDCVLTAQQGISVCSGNSLTIYCQSGRSGQLIATNPDHNPEEITSDLSGGGAAIGADRSKTAGNITINGGRITAIVKANGGACIGMGGWSGGAGTVTVNDGYLKLTCDVGGEGAFGNTGYTVKGGVIEFTGSADDNINASKVDGIVFRGNDGQVYGNATLKENFVIPAGKTLTVGEDATLTISEGVTLVNNGTIQSDGTIYNNGSITDHNEIKGNGSIVGEPAQSDYKLTLEVPQFDEVREDYSQPAAATITLKNEGALGVDITNVDISGDQFSIAKEEVSRIEAGASLSLGTIQPEADLPSGRYTATITVTYSCGDHGIKSVSAAVEFFVGLGAVPYLDSTGTEQSCTTAILVSSDSTVLKDGWYLVRDSVSISDRIQVQGDVHLILKDGCSLTATSGISVCNGNGLTIYCQSQHTGRLVAINPPEGGAAIGADPENGAGDITINGGNISATVKSQGGACIGQGGWGGEAGSVTINGGHLNLYCGAGGEGAFGENYTIYGGIVEYEESSSYSP